MLNRLLLLLLVRPVRRNPLLMEVLQCCIVHFLAFYLLLVAQIAQIGTILHYRAH